MKLVIKPLRACLQRETYDCDDYNNSKMNEIKELKQIIERQDIKSDPYWKSILHSDTRSIFPKYELAKIEIAKNKVNKLRLIIDQLPNLLTLQIYAKNHLDITKNMHEQELKKELNQLTEDLQQCKSLSNSSDYAFEILQNKEKIDYLCSELCKSKIKPEIMQVIKKSGKWKEYIQSNNKVNEQFDQLLNERDKANLSFNISLKAVDDILLTGTSAKIIQQRVKEEVMKQRLRKIFQSQKLQVNFNADNDPWARDWNDLKEKLQQKSSYV